VRSSPNNLTRRPKILSTGAPGARSAAGALPFDQTGPEAASDPENEPKAAAKTSDREGELSDRLAALPTLSLGDLRLEWRRLFRADPPRLSRDMMMTAVAYRLQEIARGGLSKATQRRLTALTVEFETGGKIAPAPGPKIKLGSRLVREWHGRTHTVCVTDDGFEFRGKTYRSLTKIASAITGAQWSGPRFFGLTKTSTASPTPPTLLASVGTISEDPNG
jgi:hypothetical protein